MSDWRIAAALASILGIGIGAWIGGRFDDEAPKQSAATPSPGFDASPHEPDPAIAAQLDALRDALDVERSERLRLAAQVDELRVQFTPAPRSDSHKAADAAAATGSAPPWFDLEAVVQAGLERAQAEQLRKRFEQAELDELYLRDTATREGWAGTARLRKELGAVRAQLRLELGDEAFDWVLFASGRDNRVLIQDVIQDSPAAESGIRSGDVIVRYDENLILTPQELRSATTQGRAGETIAVDVERDAERLRFYVPRGPLGTRLGRTRRTPDES